MIKATVKDLQSENRRLANELATLQLREENARLRQLIIIKKARAACSSTKKCPECGVLMAGRECHCGYSRPAPTPEEEYDERHV
jgi:hypothetical protein